MRFVSPALFSATLLLGGHSANAQQLNDVGLGIPALGFFTGTMCDPFVCGPAPSFLPAGTFPLVAYGPPSTPFVIGIGLPPASCQSFPGILHSYALGPFVATQAIGLIGGPDPSLPCNQGRTLTSFVMPQGFSGLNLTLQSVGVSALGGGGLAFSSPIRLTIQ